MAKMSRAAIVLLLGAAMLVSCHAQAALHKKKSSTVDCNTYCNGTDSRTRSKKGTSLPKENTPDKCGTWVQGSTACNCGNCEAYLAAPIGPRTCSPDSTGTKGYCCSCSTFYGANCACGGTSPKSATFCSSLAATPAPPSASNVCISCQKAVCCAGRAVELRQSSFTYNGVGSGTINGRIDWSANYPIGTGAWPAAVSNCPIGKYSCSGVNCIFQ